MRAFLHLIPAGLLGAAAALLVSCGSSSKGLIPLEYAGPLQSDFQAVIQAAREGDGSCSATEVEIRKTEHDLRALPSTVNGGLRGRLEEGVANLSARARVLCTQPLSQSTSTTGTSTTKTTPPPSTTTTTQPAPTTTQATTPTTGAAPAPTTSQPSGQGGGTQAPGTGNDEGRGGEAEAGGQEGAGGVGQAGPGEVGSGGSTGGTGGGR